MIVRLVIVGAGGFGREVYDWAQSSRRFLTEYSIEDIVFIDDQVPTHAPPAHVISTISEYIPRDSDLLLCAVGAPEVRERLVSALNAKGAKFATLIHDSAVLGSAVSIGSGSVICPGVTVTSNASVGRHTHINLSSVVGHDAVIGDFVTLSPCTNLNGNTRVADGVFIGTGAIVIPGVKIGTASVLGAGSVVVKNIESGVTAFGNPCRVIGRAKR